MNRKTAATVIITASLVVLMSGCAGVAAQGGQVYDDLSPAGNAAIMGLARGHVIVRDNLSNEAQRELHAQSPVRQQPVSVWSSDARREFHAQSTSTAVAQGFTPAAIRELKAGAPVGVSAAEMQGERLSAYAEAQAASSVSAAEMQGERLSAYAEAQAAVSSSSVAQGFSPAAIREMKSGAPVQVKDDLSPLNSSKPTSTPEPDTVDDDLSPLRGSR